MFTLTCTSTGGPATTVIWTRDGATVHYDDDHVLTQTVTVTDIGTVTYSNVLTVTGREPGSYQCSVTNHRGNASSQSLPVEGKLHREMKGGARTTGSMHWEVSLLC